MAFTPTNINSLNNQAGAGAFVPDGAIATTGTRIGNNNDAIISNLNPDLYEWAVRGKMFSLANQAAVTTTAGLATTFTGLAVANPAGSGVNLVMVRFNAAQMAVGVAGSVGYMTGAGAAAGALVPRNRLTGSTIASKANGTNSATIATPVLEEAVGSIGSLATTGYGLQAGISVPMNNLIIPPGQFVASYTSAACTSAFEFGFVWIEEPLQA